MSERTLEADHQQRAELMKSVPPEWREAHTAELLSRLVRDGRDARNLLRIAYAHARGWLTHLTVAAAEWEATYTALKRWDDLTSLEEAVTRLDQIVEVANAFKTAGGIREQGGFLPALSVTVKWVVFVYFSAAVYRAVKRRVMELGGSKPAGAA